LIEFRSDSNTYYIGASWEGRAETPEELAARFLRMIDSLKEIDTVFSLWTCGKKRPEKFEEVRDRYAKEIAGGITRDDWREPIPADGYRFGARTRDTPKDRSFYVTCKGGSTIKRIFTNSVTLATDSATGSRPDAEVVSYRVFRLALLAIVDAWNPVRARATSLPLIQLYKGDSLFPPVWIQYLCPWLAEKITPPSTVLSEHLPNGGLLMSATTETFDVDNPAHLKAAQDMAAAMAPLNLLSWPSSRA
jgi:hypothetical protein